jgi:hypothetical protein
MSASKTNPADRLGLAMYGERAGRQASSLRTVARGNETPMNPHERRGVGAYRPAPTMLGLLWYGPIGVRRAVWRIREYQRRG